MMAKATTVAKMLASVSCVIMARRLYSVIMATEAHNCPVQAGARRKVSKSRARRAGGAGGGAWGRTRIVRRGELVRVAQLALVLEVVDSARAHQVGGHADALATPAAVGRGSQWSVMRCSHARRAGSGRAAVGSGQGGQAHPSCPASSKSKRETVVVGSRILRTSSCGPYVRMLF